VAAANVAWSVTPNNPAAPRRFKDAWRRQKRPSNGAEQLQQRDHAVGAALVNEMYFEGTKDNSCAWWLRELAAFGESWKSMRSTPAGNRINESIRRIFVTTNCKPISEFCEFRRIVTGAAGNQL
jgi:hypothetical protein